jgi:maltose O-acetyltransferase
MKKFFYLICLQLNFFLLGFINVSYNFFPSYLSSFYLRIFGFRISPSSCIHRFCKFFHLGKLKIGRRTFISFGCYLDNRRGITIGDDVEIAHNVKIYTLGHNIDSPTFETKGKPVVVEDHVFIFSNAIIMPGVTLHKGAVVLPGAVVTKDVAEYTVVGGNPAKFVKMRNTDNQHKCFYPFILAP